MARIRINTRTHTKEKPYLINSYFFFKIGKAKKVNKVSKNKCIYASEICAEGIFVTFPWWLENVKSRSKIALFSNERHFDIWFPKKKTITFFWSKLSKLHKKDPILHVATTFSLKQGETRISHAWTHSTPLNSYIISLSGLRIRRSKFQINPKQQKPTPHFPILYAQCSFLPKNPFLPKSQNAQHLQICI